METEDIILYSPDSGEVFMSNEEMIRQAITKINQMLDQGPLTSEEISNYLTGDL